MTKDEIIALVVTLLLVFWSMSVFIVWYGGKAIDKERKAKDAAATQESTNTWCQFCDETKPTTDFTLDPIGRWACTDCRKAAGFEAEEDDSPPGLCNCSFGTPFQRNYDGQKYCLICSRPRRPGNQVKRTYEGHSLTLDDVPTHAKVKAFGNSCKIDIAGNVGDCAVIQAEGNSAKVVIHGDVGSDVLIKVLGNSAKIYIEGFIHEQCTIHADGNSAKVYYRHAHITTQVAASGNSSKVVRSTLKKVC